MKKPTETKAALVALININTGTNAYSFDHVGDYWTMRCKTENGAVPVCSGRTKTELYGKMQAFRQGVLAMHQTREEMHKAGFSDGMEAARIMYAKLK